MNAGAEYYANRIDNGNPFLVKHNETGRIGVVHRVTPAKGAYPGQAFVVYPKSEDDSSPSHSRWELVTNLTQVRAA